MNHYHIILAIFLCFMHSSNVYAEDVITTFKGAGILISTNSQTGFITVADQEKGQEIYQNTCIYCHKLDGKKSLVGAVNLKKISTRRSNQWLNQWLKSPVSFAKKDKEAQKLIDANPMLAMPTLPEMQNIQQRLDVIAYIETLQ